MSLPLDIEENPERSNVKKEVNKDLLTDHQEGDDVEQNKHSTREASNVKSDDSQDVNPYDYLNKVEFTSERFKIEVKGMHRQVGFKQLKKRMRSLGLKPHKVKILSWGAFVTFMTAEDRDKAITDMNGVFWKGKQLQVSIAKPRTDPGLETLKRKIEESDGIIDGKRRALEDNSHEEDPAQRLTAVVAPLSDVPYDEQLKMKTQRIRELLQMYYTKVTRQNILITDKLQPEKDEESGQLMICPMKSIQYSMALTYYRNKCEFTIGKNREGKDHVVGFNYGKHKGGDRSVGSPEHLINVSKSIEAVRSKLEHFIQSKFSYLPSYDAIEYAGFWRTITVRSTMTGDTMVAVEVCGSDWNNKDVVEVCDALKKFCSSQDYEQLRIKSLYFVLRQRQSDALTDSTCKLLLGEKHLVEVCMGLKFQISLAAFFQVNTLAAEVLYTKIRDLCTTGGNVVVLDLCCGTGTIGLTVAKDVYKVYGIEMCPEAVDDAKENAKRNDIENVEFSCGKVEDVLPRTLDTINPDKEIIAIVDPPRAGLHPQVISFLRKYSRVQTIIYVSCNPEASSTNFVDLGRPESNRMRGAPFIPVEATPVDLFPQTKHVELVTMWRRLKEL